MMIVFIGSTIKSEPIHLAQLIKSKKGEDFVSLCFKINTYYGVYFLINDTDAPTTPSYIVLILYKNTKPSIFFRTIKSLGWFWDVSKYKFKSVLLTGDVY